MSSTGTITSIFCIQIFIRFFRLIRTLEIITMVAMTRVPTTIPETTPALALFPPNRLALSPIWALEVAVKSVVSSTF